MRNRGPQAKRMRCRSCPRVWLTASANPGCPRHGARGIPWPARMVYAYEYILRVSRTGEDLDEFVVTFRESEYPGVSSADLRLALELARSSGDPAFREGELPEPVTPRGIYG